MKAIEKKKKDDVELNVLFTEKHINENNELYEKMYNLWVKVKSIFN
jgi:hypothetical protein